MNEYDIVVIGGGSGSQVATAAAERGLEAAVVERGPLGGACITRGCVPSKGLIHRADLLEEIRRAGEFGIDAAVRDVDYAGITDAIRGTVYEKADRQAEQLRDADGVALYRGEGRFVDERTVAIDGAARDDGDGSRDGGDGRDDGTARIRGERVVIAVGSRPTIPPVDGLEDVDFLTSDDALFLDERPDSLVVVGGGYVAAELAHFFAAVGTDVTIVGRSDRLVSREDDDVSAAVTAALERRCDVYVGHEATTVESRDGDVAVTAESGDGESVELRGEELLVAAGRRPNTDALDLESAGVETDESGYVAVDDRLETTAENVWALGDVVGAHPYKHVADYESRVVATNALSGTGGGEDGDVDGGVDANADGPKTVDYEGIPHAIFTRPQTASVGRTEGELEDEGREYESTTVEYAAAPMGMILDESESFVKVLAEPDGGAILGCHVVGAEASTMIHEVAVAMRRGGGTVDDVAETVHVHPALNEVVLKAFDDLSTKPFSTAPDWRETAER